MAPPISSDRPVPIGSDEPVLSLRSWLDEVSRLGELTHVPGADWDLEIGAISELSYRTPRPKALLFDEIVGYPAGQRVLVGSTGSPARLGLTLRAGADCDDSELVRRLRGRPSQWLAQAERFPPRTVTEAPVLRNRVAGPDVDLLSFPTPRWHAADGGRYIGTGCAVFTSDPDTGAVNAGAYRMEVVDDGATATVNAVPGKHGARNIAKWFQKEGRAPITVSLGHDPLLMVVAGTEVTAGVNELCYAGAILGEPVSVLTGETTGLPIPAGSEIALEGWLHPDDTRDEGPFGEWTGYYSGDRAPAPAMSIDALYHRDDPILLGAPPGRPPFDYSYMRTIMKSAMITDELIGLGLRGVRSAWAHEAGGGRLLVAVSITQQHAGHSRQVGHATAHCPAAAYMNRYVVVVDDDIDASDLDAVIWAICTRSDPSIDIDVMRRTWGSRLDPLYPGSGTPYISRAVIDACRPYERLDSFPKVAQSDPAYLRSVEDRWGHVLR
ncbi:MAG: UbiD family decarboxylase [Micromonosporaceae bacterium]